MSEVGLSYHYKRIKMSKKWLSLGVVSIFLLTLVFYIPAIRGGYVWDDDFYVTNNLTLRTFDGLQRIWLEIGAVPQYFIHWCIQAFG